MDTLSHSDQIPENIRNFDVDEEWTARGEFWLSNNPKSSKRGRPANERQPLVLSGHGMRLRINHGALEIRNGFTHYPQQREELRIFPGEMLRPSRIILLDGSGAITLDVISWLSTQNIPLFQLNYRGQVVAAIGGNSIGADPELLQLQIAAAQNPKRSMAVATWIVRQKLIASRQVLVRLGQGRLNLERALEGIGAEIARLAKPWAGPRKPLMGIEGKCAQSYFNVWRGMPITWKGTGRKPIPETWHAIGPRNTGANRRNRFAWHPVQAMTNYGYAVLESQIRIEAARIGLDQSVGFLHQTMADRPALILDLLEPLRPVIDGIILRFIQSHTFSPADFTLASDGTCRLHPQLARRVVAEIGQIEGIAPMLAGLLGQLGYKPPVARQHRSKAWLAQRALSEA
jgi:CRISPR-associated protein Cas1